MKSKAMNLAPHERRVVVEAFDLDDKLTKLCAFRSSEKFKNLPIDVADQLNRQADIMGEYLNILDERLASFEQADADAESDAMKTERLSAMHDVVRGLTPTSDELAAASAAVEHVMASLPTPDELAAMAESVKTSYVRLIQGYISRS